MANIKGARAITETAGISAQVKPDIDNKVYLLDGNKAPLTALTAKLRKRVTTNPKFTWFESEVESYIDAINYGTASGSVEPFPLQRLHKMSLTVTRPTLGTYIASRADLESASKAFFEVLTNGTVKVEVKGRYKLKDTAKAHADLESRKIAGAMIIVP